MTRQVRTKKPVPPVIKIATLILPLVYLVRFEKLAIVLDIKP
jgi:hypothetical protein